MDRAFFQAGVACLDAEKVSPGFVFLNHFLDLVDAIEQGLVELDHSQLEGTDIPTQVPLPRSVFCVRDVNTSYRFSGQPLQDGSRRQIEVDGGGEEATGFKGEALVEQVRAWILQRSMDVQDPFKLPLIGGKFESSLESSMPCMACGYPVQSNKTIELKPGVWAANKDDWNKLIMVTKVRIRPFFKVNFISIDFFVLLSRRCRPTKHSRIVFISLAVFVEVLLSFLDCNKMFRNAENCFKCWAQLSYGRTGRSWLLTLSLDRKF